MRNFPGTVYQLKDQGAIDAKQRETTRDKKQVEHNSRIKSSYLGTKSSKEAANCKHFDTGKNSQFRCAENMRTERDGEKKRGLLVIEELHWLEDGFCFKLWKLFPCKRKKTEVVWCLVQSDLLWVKSHLT